MSLKLIYPFYHILLVFIIPIFVVILGFKHNTTISADLSIVYSIIFMIFFPLNGNVRHYLLNAKDKFLIHDLVLFRLFSYIPLFLLSFIICLIILDLDVLKIIAIIYIGTFYWLNEIFVSNQEKKNSYFLIVFLLFIYFFLFCYVTLSNYNELKYSIILSTFCFANIIVILSIFKSLKFKINFNMLKKNITQKIIPQIGGTFVIGVSSFLFKLIILFFLSKGVSGTIFIAFTMSGVLLTIFTYGLGPTLFLNESQKVHILKIYGLLTLLMSFLGLIIILLQYFNMIDIVLIDNQKIFFYCLGFCLLGIPFSILGQYYKLHVLHKNLRLKVYFYDAIPNLSVLILLIICLYLFQPFFVGLTYIYTGLIGMLIYKKLFESITSSTRLNI